MSFLKKIVETARQRQRKTLVLLVAEMLEGICTEAAESEFGNGKFTLFKSVALVGNDSQAQADICYEIEIPGIRDRAAFNREAECSVYLDTVRKLEALNPSEQELVLAEAARLAEEAMWWVDDCDCKFLFDWNNDEGRVVEQYWTHS